MDGLHRLRQHEILSWKPAGERLFHQGCQPDGVWLLHSGKVDLLFSNSRGDVKTLNVVEAPHSLCISDVLGDEASECSAVTHTPCVLGFIDKAEFLDMLRDPNSRMVVLQAQSDELTACYDCMRMIAS